jgi:hypothetical protein
MSNIILPEPVGQRFSNLKIALKFNGYSSSSLCHYVAQTPGITHVTPGAYHDYVNGNNWNSLYFKVKNLIEQHGIDYAAEILYKDKYGK